MSCIIIKDLLDLSPYQRYLLAAFYIILGIIGTLLNIVPAYIVIRTKQQKNPSSRLAFYLSVSDLLRASLGFFVFGVTTLWHDRISMLNCWERQVLISPFIFFSMSSGYLHCLIILDRFFRVAFIQNYSAILTTRRFGMLMMLYVLIVTVQFSLVVIGDLDANMGGVAYTMPINLILFLTSVGLHMKSIHQLRIHQRTVCLTLGSRNILKLATVYLAIFMVFYGPVIISMLLVLFKNSAHLSEGTTVHIIVVTLAVASFSCPINAIAFVVKNIQARKVIRKHYEQFRKKKVLRKSNRVTTGHVLNATANDG